MRKCCAPLEIHVHFAVSAFICDDTTQRAKVFVGMHYLALARRELQWRVKFSTDACNDPSDLPNIVAFTEKG